MSNVTDYRQLYEDGAYREAYNILRSIMEDQQSSSKSGEMYVLYADLELILNDDVDKAGQLLSKAQELGCLEMAHFFRTKGYVLSRTGEIGKGIQFLFKSAALDPRLSNLKTLASVLVSNNDDRIIGLCQRILEQDPENCSAHVYLGIQAVKSGNRDKASLIVKQTQKRASTAYEFFDIAWLYQELREYRNAVDAYSEADRRNYEPKGPLYAAMASCYFAMGDLSAATRFSAKAIEINFGYDDTKDLLLWCLNKGHFDSTVNDLMEKYRDTSFASIIIAQRALQDKELSQAREMCNSAERANPSAAEMFNIAHLWSNLGCFKRALAASFKAEKLGYRHGDRLCHSIADSYYSLHDYNAARRYAHKALLMNPDNEQAKELLQLAEKKY